jgi:hypothetical protein
VPEANEFACIEGHGPLSPVDGHPELGWCPLCPELWAKGSHSLWNHRGELPLAGRPPSRSPAACRNVGVSSPRLEQLCLVSDSQDSWPTTSRSQLWRGSDSFNMTGFRWSAKSWQRSGFSFSSSSGPATGSIEPTNAHSPVSLQRA